jgi:hypothetical protein
MLNWRDAVEIDGIASYPVFDGRQPFFYKSIWARSPMPSPKNFQQSFMAASVCHPLLLSQNVWLSRSLGAELYHLSKLQPAESDCPDWQGLKIKLTSKNRTCVDFQHI